MKSKLKISLQLGFACICLSAFCASYAQEQARVLSSTPVVKQFYAPQQVCGTSQVGVVEPKSGAGAALGAVAGGLIGSTMGGGAAGQAASTAIGMIGGAMVGNSMEASRVDTQNVTTCSTQNTLQSVTVYQVVYEFGGKQYNAEMQNDPGQFVTIQINPIAQGQIPPVGSVPPPGSAPNGAPNGAPTIASTIIAPAPAYVAAPYPYPYPYAYPYPYSYGYAPPFSIGLGFYGGCCWHHRRR